MALASSSFGLPVRDTRDAHDVNDGETSRSQKRP
jgi:hypothetical protein